MQPDGINITPYQLSHGLKGALSNEGIWTQPLHWVVCVCFLPIILVLHSIPFVNLFYCILIFTCLVIQAGKAVTLHRSECIWMESTFQCVKHQCVHLQVWPPPPQCFFSWAPGCSLYSNTLRFSENVWLNRSAFLFDGDAKNKQKDKQTHLLQVAVWSNPLPTFKCLNCFVLTNQ